MKDNREALKNQVTGNAQETTLILGTNWMVTVMKMIRNTHQLAKVTSMGMVE